MKINCENCRHSKTIFKCCLLNEDMSNGKCEKFEPNSKAIRQDTKNRVYNKILKWLSAKRTMALKIKDEHTAEKVKLLDECIDNFKNQF